VEAIWSPAQAGRVRGIRDGSMGIAKQNPQDFRQVLDPGVEGEDVPQGARRCRVVREDRGRDRHNPGIEDVGIHGREVTLDRLRSLTSEDVVHSREDDRVCRTDLEDVSREPGANFLRGLAVDASIQDGPL